jgi:hypothetical protein
VLTLVLAVLLTLLGLLAIPLGLNYRVNWRGRLRGDIQLRWLFGLLRISIPTESSPAGSPPPAGTRRHRQAKARRRTNPLAVWGQRRFRQRLLRFARDLWQAIHKRDLCVQLRIGLDDPADTGRLWAIMGPLSAFASCSPAIEIDIEPDFMQSTLEFSSSGQIRIIPLQLLGLALGLLLSPAFWQGMLQFKRAG